MKEEWRVPEDIQRQTWSVIEYPDFSVVVPSRDSAPHDVESMTCACKPRTEYSENTQMVVHNSWRDLKAIDDSLKGLF